MTRTPCLTVVQEVLWNWKGNWKTQGLMVYGWWAGGIPDLTLLLCVVARTPAGCLVYVDVVARTPAGLMISRLEQEQGAQVIPCSMES